MDNVDLAGAAPDHRQWQASGHRVVLGTITRTWGSAPRPPGSAVAGARRRPGGRQRVGGLHRGRPDRQGPRAACWPRACRSVVRYGIDADAAHRFGLPCGGLIELVLEPVAAAHPDLPELLAAAGRRASSVQPCADHRQRRSGRCRLAGTGRRAACSPTPRSPPHHGARSWRLLGHRRRPDDPVPGPDGPRPWATRCWCATRATSTPKASPCPAPPCLRTMPDDTVAGAQARRPHRHHRPDATTPSWTTWR